MIFSTIMAISAIKDFKIQEVDEGEIVRSKAWARLTSRLAGVLCPECRARAAEAVGE